MTPKPSTAHSHPQDGSDEILDGVPTIHERMVAVLGELPAVPKAQRNVEQKFNFRGIDDVLNALNPLLAKHGVFYIPNVIERIEEKRTTSKGSVMHTVHLHIEYRFYGLAGDYVSASGWGEGTDMGDKATNKATTGAMKYVLFQVFAISTEDTADADLHTPEETRPERKDDTFDRPTNMARLRELLPASGKTEQDLLDSFHVTSLDVLTDGHLLGAVKRLEELAGANV